MKKQTAGIHHITAIVGHPQENIDFYAGVLGLRLVKQTVNFDDPGTYHLYFGDGGGKPGTIITFFPWADAVSRTNWRRTSWRYDVCSATRSIRFLGKPSCKICDSNIKKQSVLVRQVIQFDDPHGLHLEIVEREAGEQNNWTFGEVTPEVAIKGFGGATLYSSRPEETAKTLANVMGLELVGTEGDYTRFKASADIGNIIDLKMVTGVSGTMGVGTVHHIAWRAKDDADHLEWQQHAMNLGQRVTELKDRNYFNALYFRESGEILFEIATDPPGFAHDETLETMGTQLMLPAQYEQHREQLVNSLIPIQVRPID